MVHFSTHDLFGDGLHSCAFKKRIKGRDSGTRRARRAIREHNALLRTAEGDEEAARFFPRLRPKREPRAIVQTDEDHRVVTDPRLGGYSKTSAALSVNSSPCLM